MAAVILSTVLIIPGGGVVLYSAAIGGIPSELYEAADVEGAGWYSKWRHITIPLLRPTTLYLVVVYTILAFQVFERVYIMTNGGGPNNATITIVQLIYSTAFQFGRYGLASAQAVVLFVMAVAVASSSSAGCKPMSSTSAPSSALSVGSRLARRAACRAPCAGPSPTRAACLCTSC